MKRNILCGLALLVAGTLMADPKDDVKAAAKKLGDSANYTWKSTPDAPPAGAGGAPGGGRGRGGRGGFGGGPVEGQTEKGGYTHLTMTGGRGATEGYVKGEKGAMKGQDGWMSFAEAADQGQGGFNPAMRFTNAKTPDVEAATLADKSKDLKKDGDVYSGTLSEDGVKALATAGFGGRGGQGGGPELSNPKGTVKFTVKDGVLMGYEYKVSYGMSFNGNDVNIDRGTKIEISNVGSTKVEIPDDVKKKAM